jgi:hypothetical protein
MLRHRVAKVGERVDLAVTVGAEGGAAGGEQVGEVPPCVGQ